MTHTLAGPGHGQSAEPPLQEWPSERRPAPNWPAEQWFDADPPTEQHPRVEFVDETGDQDEAGEWSDADEPAGETGAWLSPGALDCATERFAMAPQTSGIGTALADPGAPSAQVLAAAAAALASPRSGAHHRRDRRPSLEPPPAPARAAVLDRPHGSRRIRLIVVLVLAALVASVGTAVALDKSVTITVDGQDRTVHTFAPDVSGALARRPESSSRIGTGSNRLRRPS